MASTLSPKEEMVVDQRYSATNGIADLVFQRDGDLVLSERGKPIWHTNTFGSGADRCVMQANGNLVVYAGGHCRWQSYTAGHPNASLVVQDDRNVVISDGARAIWATKTYLTLDPEVSADAKPWGLVLTLSHRAAQDLARGGAAAQGIVGVAAAAITAVAATAQPTAGSGLLAAGGLIDATDNGNGVYLTMFWPKPGRFIPTTRI